MAKKNDTTVQTAILIDRNDKVASRGGLHVAYQLPGFSSIYIPRAMFEGEPPATLSLDGATFAAAKTPKAKMTEEERKAAALARKNRTPAQVLAEAEARIAKAQEKADKLKAMIGLSEAEYAATKA